MRTISEQELKIILDKHGKWLKNEEGGERADLSYVNLSYADLRYVNLSAADLRAADLRYADLSYANLSAADLRAADLRYVNLSAADLRYVNLSAADLRYADLSYANLSAADLRFANLSAADLRFANLIIFQFQREFAYYTLDGTLRIGCVVMPISEWEIGYKEIGKSNDYTEDQILMYGGFISACLTHFKKNNP